MGLFDFFKKKKVELTENPKKAYQRIFAVRSKR